MDGGAAATVLSNTGTIKVAGRGSNAPRSEFRVTANVSMAGLAGGAALSDTSATPQPWRREWTAERATDKIVNTGAHRRSGKIEGPVRRASA